MILVIDNYDSFTYNLVQYLGEIGAELKVVRNDQITVETVIQERPKGIVLSPGPCTPKESGVCIDILHAAYSGALPPTPILGVCLGHQAIGYTAGGVVGASRSIMHGKTSQVSHDGKGVYEDLPNPFQVTRYHSLAVYEDGLPECLHITSRALDDGEVMGVRHKSLPIEGVQFHPESVLTQDGMLMMVNFLSQC